MKRIVISGVSGVGKSTLINNLSNEGFFTISEMIEGTVSHYWWAQVSNKMDDYDYEMSKKMMVGSRMIEAFNNLKTSKTTIYDRSLIDVYVMLNLRYKKYTDFYKWIMNKFNSLIEEAKQNNILPDKYIILKADFEVMSERIKTRGRADESNNIKSDDSWYRQYHESYNDLLISILEKHGIEKIIIDTTKLSAKEVLEKVIKLL